MQIDSFVSDRSNYTRTDHFPVGLQTLDTAKGENISRIIDTCYYYTALRCHVVALIRI